MKLFTEDVCRGCFHGRCSEHILAACKGAHRHGTPWYVIIVSLSHRYTYVGREGSGFIVEVRTCTVRLHLSWGLHMTDCAFRYLLAEITEHRHGLL